MSRSFILLLAIFAVGINSGCATIPGPYQAPSKDASLEERQKIYDEHYVSNDWMGHHKIGGKVVYGSFRAFSNYFSRSGDPFSAAIAKKGESYIWVGLTAAVACLAVGGLVTGSTG